MTRFFHSYYGDLDSTYDLLLWGEILQTHNFNWLFRPGSIGSNSPIFPLAVATKSPVGLTIEDPNPTAYTWDPDAKHVLVDKFRPYDQPHAPYVEWLWSILELYYYNFSNENPAPGSPRQLHIANRPAYMTSTTLEFSLETATQNKIAWYVYDGVVNKTYKAIHTKEFTLDLTNVCVYSVTVEGPDSDIIKAAIRGLHPQLLWEDRQFTTIFTYEDDEESPTEFLDVYEQTDLAIFFDYLPVNVYAFTRFPNNPNRLYPSDFRLPQNLNPPILTPSFPSIGQGNDGVPYDAAYEAGNIADSESEGTFNNPLVVKDAWILTARRNTRPEFLTVENTLFYFVVQYREITNYILELSSWAEALDQIRLRLGYYCLIPAENNPWSTINNLSPTTPEGEEPRVYQKFSTNDLRFMGLLAGSILTNTLIRTVETYDVVGPVFETELPSVTYVAAPDDNPDIGNSQKYFGTLQIDDNRVLFLGSQGSPNGGSFDIPTDLVILGTGINDPAGIIKESNEEYKDRLLGKDRSSQGAVLGRLQTAAFLNPNRWIPNPQGDWDVETSYEFQDNFLRYTYVGFTGNPSVYYTKTITTEPGDEEEDPWIYIDPSTAIIRVLEFWEDPLERYEMTSNTDLKETREYMNLVREIAKRVGIVSDNPLYEITIPPISQEPGEAVIGPFPVTSDGSPPIAEYTNFRPRQAPRRTVLQGTTATDDDEFPSYWGTEGIRYFTTRRSTVTDDEFGGGGRIVRDNTMLVHNLPQLWYAMMFDFTVALSLPELSANYVPSADLSGRFCEVKGLYSLLSEIAYVGSSISAQTGETLISSLVTQAMTIDNLTAWGQPLQYKSLPVVVQNKKRTVPYIGLAPDAPSQLDQTGWIMQSLGIVTSAVTRPREDVLEDGTTVIQQ